ncbi:MAG: T9SS type A sorting domain-containing protein [Moheibacter sp.]
MSLKSKISLVFLFIFSGLFAQNRFHVTPDGSNTADGLSWANAVNIQRAFDLANGNDEIWISQGTYSITQTLEIASGASQVLVYGGFVGTETLLNQRDWQNNLTVLDGNTTTQILIIRGNYATIDGLIFQNGYITGTITGGPNPNTGGGAIRIYGGNSTIQNCTFQDNISSSERGGGAIFIWYGNTHLIDNCTFYENANTNTSGNGGGAIHNWEDDVTISNSYFYGNSSSTGGGSIYTWGYDLNIDNCVFESNHSDSGGGAIHNNGSNTIITNSVFDTNSSVSHGGSINNDYQSLHISNTIFSGNESTVGDGGAIYNNSNEGLWVTNSLFNDNSAEGGNGGGAIYNSNNASITNTTFFANHGTALVHQTFQTSTNFTYSTTVYNSIFYQNTSIGAGYRADISPRHLGSDQSDKDIRSNIVQEYDLGTNNMIGIDPKFVSSTNLSLQTSSPAINAGNNTLYNTVSPTAIGASTDLAGNPRLYGAAIDYGAYELQEEMSTVDLDKSILNFYPNPVSNILTISTKKNIEEFTVFNTLGQKVLNSTNVKNGQIDVSSLSSGVYVFQVKMEDGKVETIKIVKK